MSMNRNRRSPSGEEGVVKTETDRDNRSFVSAFARGLSIIEVFDGNKAPLSLTQVATGAGVDRAVARRLLLTLEKLGYVSYEGKHYRLTPRVLRLGYSYLSQSSTDDILQYYVNETARRTTESASISVLDGTDVVCVAHASSPVHKTGFTFLPGSRLPAYVSAGGRVMLAFRRETEARKILQHTRRQAFTPSTNTDVPRLCRELAKVREKGYALVDGELERGLLSVAVPVRNRRDEVVGSLNVSSTIARSSAATLRAAVVPVMTQVAEELRQVLGPQL